MGIYGENQMKKNTYFRISYEEFDLTSCEYEERTLLSYDEEFVNFKINELFHNDDTGFIFVEKMDEFGNWIPCDLTDDHTKTWKEFSHMYYVNV